MLEKYREPFHKWSFWAGLTIIAIGMPSSVFLMSIGQLILGGNWILEGRYREKLQKFWDNKPAVIFASIFLLHVIALFYSTDFAYGSRDLRTKLPIFALTFIIASSRPLDAGMKKWIAMAFCGTITVVSLISLSMYVSGGFTDHRELSPFVSHIRVSLMVTLSIVLLHHFARNQFAGQRGWKITCYAMAAWHVVYLLLLQSLTGVVVFLAVLFLAALKKVFQGSWKVRLASVAGILLIAGLSAGTVYLAWQELQQDHPKDLTQLETHTTIGNTYRHDTTSTLKENGHLVYLYISENELEQAWNKRSPLDYNGKDERGQELRHTLWRYMTSRGLRKDADGITRMREKDIMAVESGVTNVNYIRWPGVFVRIHQTLWEVQRYQETRNPSGHSFTMRFEFLRATWEAIQAKPWFGWGTGDIYVATEYGYEKTQTLLHEDYRMRAHNQYFSFVMAFGIVGFVWIFFAILYPPIRLRAFGHFPFLAWFVIFMLSMINEDTIETQAGLTFFVFFFNYFLFLKEKPGKEKELEYNL